MAENYRSANTESLQREVVALRKRLQDEGRAAEKG